MRLRTMFLASATIALAAPLSAQQGIVREGLTLKSAILGKDVRYTVYLPADYETSTRQYPVVYLLHGLGDDESGWIQFGEANRIVDQAIASGDIPPMILVTPDGGVSWYINSDDGKVRWEDMFIQEFMPHIEATYRIRKDRQYRGLAGLSMGGYGSLILALHHPDLFSAVAALSPGIFSDSGMATMGQAGYDRTFGPIFGAGKLGTERLTAHWRQNSVIEQFRTLPLDQVKRVRYYIDIGDDDFLYEGNSELHILLRKRQIPHEYRVRDGTHAWVYWRTGLPDGLRFIGAGFRR